MAGKYMETAGKANVVAQNLLAMVPEDARPAAAALIAQLVNLGVRCNPRPAMSTVRYNAVVRAVRGLPVTVGMKEVTPPGGGRSFKALTVTPKGGPEHVEGSDGDDGGE